MSEADPAIPPPFATQAELRRAFSDPRYAPTLPGNTPNPKYDAAYREQVLARMIVTAPAMQPGGGGLKSHD